MSLDCSLTFEFTNVLQQGCSLKEAAIVASVLAKTKIPVLHASAALLRIAEMDYSGEMINVKCQWRSINIDPKVQTPYSSVC